MPRKNLWWPAEGEIFLLTSLFIGRLLMQRNNKYTTYVTVRASGRASTVSDRPREFSALRERRYQ